MPAIFVDTSALYGLADRADGAHVAAVRVERQVRGSDLVTTDLVVVEAWLLARTRRGREAAMRLWRGVRTGGLRVELIQPQDLERAWTIAEEFADQDFSLVDCVSFAFIERNGIRQAFSFDRDFQVFRYGPRRGIHLDVLGLSEL